MTRSVLHVADMLSYFMCGLVMAEDVFTPVYYVSMLTYTLCAQRRLSVCPVDSSTLFTVDGGQSSQQSQLAVASQSTVYYVLFPAKVFHGGLGWCLGSFL